MTKKTNLSKTCKKAGFLVKVFPLQFLQETYRTPKGIEKVDNRRAMAFGTFRLKFVLCDCLQKD